MSQKSLHASDTAQRLARIEHVAGLLDSRFRLPVVGVRVGWDSILGLIPGLGDIVTTLPAGWMILQGHRMGARKRTLARMGLNAAFDLAIGTVPIIGDFFDVAFKSHQRNLALLKSEMAQRGAHTNFQEVANG